MQRRTRSKGFWLLLAILGALLLQGTAVLIRSRGVQGVGVPSGERSYAGDLKLTLLNGEHWNLSDQRAMWFC